MVFEPIKSHNVYLFHLMAGVRNMLYEYSYHHSAYQQDKGKRTLPTIEYVDTQYKSPRTNFSSSAVYSSQTKTSRMPAAAPGKTLRRDIFQQEYRPSSFIKNDVSHVGASTEQREKRIFPSPYLISQKREAPRGTVPEKSRREAGSIASFLKESATIRKDASPSISENVRKEDMPTFSSRDLHSPSNQTNYESRPRGRTHTANEKIGDHKVAEKQASVFLEERGTKERLTKEITLSGVEKVYEKSVPGGRNAHIEQRAEIKQGAADTTHTVEEYSTEQNRKDDTVVKHKAPQGGGSYIRWEERIQKDVSERHLPADTKAEEGHPSQKKNVSVETQIKETAEIPAHSERHDRERTLKSDSIEVTLQDVKSTVGNQKHGSVFQPAGESNQVGGSKEASSKIGTFFRESIAENIVSDILKDFVSKSSDPRLHSATSEKKDVSVDEKVKTQAKAQGIVQGDPNASDYFDLVGFLKRDAKKVLEDHQGTLHKDVVEDTVGANEEGGFKKVEIVEEPFGSTSGERMEFSTPFEVEEAEDTMPGMAGYPDYYEEGKATTSTAKDLKEKRPSVVVSHVEEVAEGDEEVDEEKYYVSTPDEYPSGHEQDKDSIYGQIHIEEESTVKYSWQDEFLQGSQTKINESLGSPEMVYEVMRGETGAYISNEDVPKEQVACAETIVIEKEIKIPHEFQDTIKGLLSQESKDPKQQLKEALEKLEDTLPESVKQELSEITKESEDESRTLEVDIRKVEGTQKGGSVTIVAEVNLSQTLDSDQFNMEFLGEGLADEIKFPTRSSSGDGLEAHKKQESESHEVGRNNIRVDVSSTPWMVEELSSSAQLSGHDGTKHLSSEQVIYQGPVFKSTEAESGGDEHLSPTSFDINRRIKQIVIGPTEVRRTEHVFYEVPVEGGSQFGKEDFATGTSADASQSVQEFKRGPEEIQTTETIIFRSPVRKSVEVSGSESSPQVQFSTDVRSSGRISLASKQVVEEVVFEEPAPDLSPTNGSEASFQMKGPAETSRSVRHIRIDPQEVHSEHVVYEGRFPGMVEVSSGGDHVMAEESVRHIRVGQQETRMSERTSYEEFPTETTQPSLKDGLLDTSASIRHIKLSPKEFVSEQIVFMGPTSEQHLGFSGPRQDSPTGSVRHIQLGQAGVQSGEHVVFHGSFSESSGISSPGEDVLEEGGPTDVSNRTTRHIRLSSSETPAEQIVFHGPVSETVRVSTAEPSPTDGPSQSSRPVGQVKIGAKEASFTFQMDVTNVAGGRQEATILIPGKKEVETDSPEASMKDGQREKERNQELTFHQSVQLQRMVDQRSVISDEKKIALLYLNEGEGEEEEEEDGEDGPWF